MNALKNLDLNNKLVFLRADLNVPVKDGKIQDLTRISRVVPTIKFLKEKGARIILASHFDRPDGKVVPSMSLKFMIPTLQVEFGSEVLFSSNCVGEEVHKLVKSIRKDQILLLENLRFYPGEESNDKDFAKQLAELAELYVNDAFACSHRAHASIAAITEYIPSFPGLLMTEELTNLESSLNSSSRPTVAIVGGKKVSSKFPILHNLSARVDTIVIGGAMANTFLKAKGFEIHKSYHEVDLVNDVVDFLKNVKCEIVLPSDVVCAQLVGEKFIDPYVCDVMQVKQNASILDIGPDSCESIVSILKHSKTVVWNGPVGMFEDQRFACGTHTLARAISKLTIQNKIKSIAGGGDVVSALEQADLAKNFSYISTAGGAFLEWLEGKELPGITALKR